MYDHKISIEKCLSSGYLKKVTEFHHTHAPGPGVFMEEIIKELEGRGVKFEIEDAHQ